MTVRAEKSGGYQAEAAEITIKVSPARQNIKAMKTKKGGKIMVKWKRDKHFLPVGSGSKSHAVSCGHAWLFGDAA